MKKGFDPTPWLLYDDATAMANNAVKALAKQCSSQYLRLIELIELLNKRIDFLEKRVEALEKR